MFHVLAALAKPPDPTPVQQGDKKGLPTRSTPRGLLRDIMKQAMAVANNSGPPLPSMGECVVCVCVCVGGGGGGC